MLRRFHCAHIVTILVFLTNHDTATAFSSPPFASTRKNLFLLRAKSEVEQQENKETVTADNIAGNNVNGISQSSATSFRYDNLLSDIGLSGETELVNLVQQLPAKHIVSPYDIFCNRELKLNQIKAVGFDMDFTLAQYKQPAFDKLAFDGAKEKLVRNLGFPEAVLDFQYDHNFWTRGLIIDTARGNFLKIDRHKYVRVAYHGFERMSSTTRKLLYRRTFNKVMSFSEKQFVNMDTLFQFVDAHLFACLVDLKDKGEHEMLDFKTYEELYRNVRECVDLCHRDGVIKVRFVCRRCCCYVLYYMNSFF